LTAKSILSYHELNDFKSTCSFVYKGAESANRCSTMGVDFTGEGYCPYGTYNKVVKIVFSLGFSIQAYCL